MNPECMYCKYINMLCTIATCNAMSSCRNLHALGFVVVDVGEMAITTATIRSSDHLIYILFEEAEFNFTYAEE